MTREQITERVTRMMVETFELPVARVTTEARLYEDLELDSIDALDMVVKLQELTHRRVKEDELRQLRSVGDVIELVLRAQAGDEDDRRGGDAVPVAAHSVEEAG